MYLWSGREDMQCWTVRISVSMSSQHLKAIKVILTNLLSSNLDKKVIIYTNTVTKAESIKDEIESWLNLTSSFDGDTIMINGDMESEVKLMSATTFTSELNRDGGSIGNTTNAFHPVKES
jgi:hypothetical protein